MNILTILQCFVRNFFIAIKELQPAPGFKEFQRRPPDFRLFFRNSSEYVFLLEEYVLLLEEYMFLE